MATDQVIARHAFDEIVPILAGEHVIGTATIDEVGTLASGNEHVAVAAADQNIRAGRTDRHFDRGLGEVENHALRSHGLGYVEAGTAIDQHIFGVEDQEIVSARPSQSVSALPANDPVIVGIACNYVRAISPVDVAESFWI